MKNYLEKKPKDGYGFIYKYVSPSKKIYIGQTTKSLKERAGIDGNNYKNSHVFYDAILKYGYDNLKVEILGEFLIEELNEKETYYINYYNSLIPNGYNIVDGPTQHQLAAEARKHKINQYNLNGEYIKTYNSITEAAKENNVFYQTISKCVRKIIPQCNGYIYRYKEEKDKPEPIKIQNTHGRKTGQYDFNNNLIAIYPSANQAALAIGKDSNAGRNIRAVCAGQRQSAYGFKWKYLD